MMSVKIEVKVSKTVSIEGALITLGDLERLVSEARAAGLDYEEKVWVRSTHDSQREGPWVKIQVGT